MRRMSVFLITVILTGSAVSSGPAQAASGPWISVMSTDLRGVDRFEAVTAASRRNAWAFGTRDFSVRRPGGQVDSRHEPIAYHWNGKRWTRSKLPSGLPADQPDYYNSNHYTASGLSASTDGNAWAVTLDDTGPPRVLRWNGRAWRLSKVARKGGPVLAVAAYGKDKALAFGRGGRNWIFERGRWRAGKRLPFDVEQTSSDGKRVWVQAVVKKRLTVARWNGGSWKTLPSTGITAFSGDDTATFKAWRNGKVTVSAAEGERVFFLTWTGRAWVRDRTEAIRNRVMRCLADDGRGGMWAMSDGVSPMDGTPLTLWHRDARGRWRLVWTGGPSGVPTVQRPEACAALPGTRTVWGVGADEEHDWDTDGTIRKLVAP